MLTAAGEAVGSAGITTSRGQTFVLLNITTGKPGMSYECFLVGKDGQRTSGGKWTLTSEYGSEQASGSWLVPVSGDAPVARRAGGAVRQGVVHRALLSSAVWPEATAGIWKART